MRVGTMERKDHIDLFGAVALTGFSLLLALNQVVVKVATAGFSPVFMASLRSVGGALLLLLWIRLRGKPVWMPPGATIWGVVLGVLFAVEFMCLFTALDLTTVSRASVIFYTMPVWLSLAAHVLIPGERIGRAKALGLALAVCGVAVAFADRGGEARATSLAGDILSLIGAMLWAGIALVVRTTPAGRAAPETQLFWQLAVSAPLLFLAALLFGPFLRELTPLHVAALGFQIVAVVTAGFLLWFWLLTIYPASGVVSFSFLSPVFSVLLGWLLLGERISLSVWMALALVALGILLINKPQKRPRPEPRPA